MGFRLSKIYTRTGDAGETGLAGSLRVPKHHPRVTAMAAIDELNCAIGLIRAGKVAEPLDLRLHQVQHHLFQVGAELALPGHPCVRDAYTAFLEESIDLLNAALPPLREFVLPGGTPAAAQCHLARAICRRAETHCALLHSQESLSPALLAYVNRLSDFLFVAARWLNLQDRHPETLWQPDWDKTP